MPAIKPCDIVSFSSEDPNHPASNLLLPDHIRKWKCKDVGEREAFVIFKFDKAVTFKSINLVNEFSAMAEIFVARSGLPNPEFKSLVSQFSFMSPAESRNGTNGNRVKLIPDNKFDKTLASEKWDLVKVVCSQLFNTHIQFGLSNIDFTIPDDPNDKPKFGGFVVRDKPLSDDAESPSASAVSHFSKHLQKRSGDSPSSPVVNTPNSVSAAIRQTSSIASAAIASSEERVKELKKQKLGSLDDNAKKSSSGLRDEESEEEEDETQSDSDDGKKPSAKANGSSQSSHKSSKWKFGDEDEEDDDSNKDSSASQAKPGPSKATVHKKSKKRLTKPFHRLFENVVFVMSGFVNPQRANIRKKAEKMGGKCKHEWDSTCTHLICAVYDTPKFREVRASGHGNIVTKHWIEKSYDKKCRLPWRRYCLDRNDRGDESEEEIYAEDEDIEDEEEEEPGSRSRQSSQNDQGRRRNQKMPPSNNGEEEDEAVRFSPKKKRKRQEITSDEEEEEEHGKKPSTSKKDIKAMEQANDDAGSETPDDVYDGDTDVENDEAKTEKPTNKGTDKNNKDGGSDFFTGKAFVLHFNDKPSSTAEKKLLRANIEQIILKHKGSIKADITGQVEYIVTDLQTWGENFSEALIENPYLNVVSSQWILECEKEKRLTSTENFLILPE